MLNYCRTCKYFNQFHTWENYVSEPQAGGFCIAGYNKKRAVHSDETCNLHETAAGERAVSMTLPAAIFSIKKQLDEIAEYIRQTAGDSSLRSE